MERSGTCAGVSSWSTGTRSPVSQPRSPAGWRPARTRSCALVRSMRSTISGRACPRRPLASWLRTATPSPRRSWRSSRPRASGRSWPLPTWFGDTRFPGRRVPCSTRASRRRGTIRRAWGAPRSNVAAASCRLGGSSNPMRPRWWRARAPESRCAAPTPSRAQDGAPLILAGIHEAGRFSLVTTEPSPVVAPVAQPHAACARRGRGSLVARRRLRGGPRSQRSHPRGRAGSVGGCAARRNVSRETFVRFGGAPETPRAKGRNASDRGAAHGDARGREAGAFARRDVSRETSVPIPFSACGFTAMARPQARRPHPLPRSGIHGAFRESPGRLRTPMALGGAFRVRRLPITADPGMRREKAPCPFVGDRAQSPRPQLRERLPARRRSARGGMFHVKHLYVLATNGGALRRGGAEDGSTFRARRAPDRRR